jgi:molybdenum cofactor biosynthesis protein B
MPHLPDTPISARCAIVTFSDTRTADTDSSGALIRDLLTAAGHLITDYRIVREDPPLISAAFDDLLGRPDLDLLITTGGTGISPRDHTIPILQPRLSSPLPGFGELFRMLSYEQVGAAAMLSQATAGIANGTPVFALPGSPKAVKLALEKLIIPELPHVLHEQRRAT